MEGLPEVAGRILGDPAAHLGDACQLAPAIFIFGLVSQVLGQFGVARHELLGRLQGDQGCVVEDLLLKSLCLGSVPGCLNPGAQTLYPQVQPTFHVGQDVALGVVGLVQTEGFALHRCPDVVRKARSDDVLQRLAPPIGEDLLTQLSDLLRPDVEPILRSSGQNFKLPIYPIHCSLGRDDAHAGQQRTIAHDQFIGMDSDAHAPDKVQQHLGPTERHRLALGALVALRRVASSLDVDLALVMEQALPNASYPLRRAGGFPCILGKGQCWIGFELVYGLHTASLPPHFSPPNSPIGSFGRLEVAATIAKSACPDWIPAHTGGLRNRRRGF